MQTNKQTNTFPLADLPSLSPPLLVFPLLNLYTSSNFNQRKSGGASCGSGEGAHHIIVMTGAATALRSLRCRLTILSCVGARLLASEPLFFWSFMSGKPRPSKYNIMQ